MCRRARPERRSAPIVLRMYVFKRRKLLMLLSQVHVVTGNVAKSTNIWATPGQSSSPASLADCTRDAGNLSAGYLDSAVCHMSSSARSVRMLDPDGRSAAQSSANFRMASFACGGSLRSRVGSTAVKRWPFNNMASFDLSRARLF